MTNIFAEANISRCPERVEYKKFINSDNNELSAKEYDNLLKALKALYLQNFHDYFEEVYPHLLYERTNDKVYWNYEDTEGVYTELSFSEVRSMVIKLMMNEDLVGSATEAFVKLVLNRYRASNEEKGVTLDSFSLPSGWLHVKNGWLNLATKELQPHTPERLSLNKMDTDYSPDAMCPLYDKFLDSDTQMPKDQIRVIDQFGGYVLTDGIEQHTCLILEGRKGCGKSMLVEIWMNMLGSKAIPLQLTALQGGGERFIGQTLAYKNLIWFDEANPRTTSINEFFQNLITGEKIRIERKGVQGDDYVNNTIKVVLSLNEMPDHMPTGMDRRYRHIVFHRSFYEEGIVDPDYKKKILENEKSGILNRMLRGLDDLRKMNRLTMIDGEEDRKREYALTSDDFSSFLSDHFEPTPMSEGIIRYSYEEMRNAFVAEYPKSYNKQLSVRSFNKKLLATRLPEFKYVQTAKSGGTRGYKGLKLKEGHEFAVGEFDPIKTPKTVDF
jgi:P4 family phage/plasmid primase-like protien